MYSRRRFVLPNPEFPPPASSSWAGLLVENQGYLVPLPLTSMSLLADGPPISPKLSDRPKPYNRPTNISSIPTPIHMFSPIFLRPLQRPISKATAYRSADPPNIPLTCIPNLYLAPPLKPPYSPPKWVGFLYPHFQSERFSPQRIFLSRPLGCTPFCSLSLFWRSFAVGLSPQKKFPTGAISGNPDGHPQTSQSPLGEESYPPTPALKFTAGFLYKFLTSPTTSNHPSRP